MFGKNRKLKSLLSCQLLLFRVCGGQLTLWSSCKLSGLRMCLPNTPWGLPHEVQKARSYFSSSSRPSFLLLDLVKSVSLVGKPGRGKPLPSRKRIRKKLNYESQYANWDSPDKLLFQEGGDTHIPMADLRWYMPETNNIVKQLSSN